MKLVGRLVIVVFGILLFWLLAVRTDAGRRLAQDDRKDAPAPVEGIPVTSSLVADRCGSCHSRDERGCLSRISYERRTPEGWEEAIKRMVRLNDVNLTPDDARKIVKYLSKNHGLAPDESRAAFYEAERRLVDEKAPTDAVRVACMQCHGLGRILSQRRTREEWVLLGNLHVAQFPAVTGQGFYRFTLPPGLPHPAESEGHPLDSAIDYFAKTYPLLSTEWQTWSRNIRDPRLEGRWLVVGYQLGRGRILGEMTVRPGQSDDEFTTSTTLRAVNDGSTWMRSGRAIVYAGHSWRGRSTAGGDNGPDSIREVMLVSRDWNRLEGRWFWGGYDEMAIDVSLLRIGSEPLVSLVEPYALRAGVASQKITIYGANLPGGLQAGDIDLGPGIRVERVGDYRPDAITLEISVAEGAPNGVHDVSLRHHIASGAVAVFDKIDYIRVLPEAGLARLGGIKYPKQVQQFEAVAYNRGADGAPGTEDDLRLGSVGAKWSIEEFPASYYDDDKDFVGTLDGQGLFTPAFEGPNPKRANDGSNYGEVWVVASYRPEPARPDGPTLKARAYLLVTVPVYVRWDTPELSK